MSSAVNPLVRKSPIAISGILAPVKRVIRRKGGGVYLSADGKWVADSRLAQDFANAEMALSAVQGLRLQNVELVLLIGEQPSEYDIALPLLTGSESAQRLEL